MMAAASSAIPEQTTAKVFFSERTPPYFHIKTWLSQNIQKCNVPSSFVRLPHHIKSGLAHESLQNLMSHCYSGAVRGSPGGKPPLRR